MKATIEKLKEELENYEERVSFLTGYIHFIRVNEYSDEMLRLDALDKAYSLQNELDFKTRLIEQRKNQIKQIEEQDKLKEKAIQEMPEILDRASDVFNEMVKDLDTLKKGKRNKDVNNMISILEQQISQADEIIDGIDARISNEDYSQVLNDFRQLHNIINLK